MLSRALTPYHIKEKINISTWNRKATGETGKGSHVGNRVNLNKVSENMEKVKKTMDFEKNCSEVIKEGNVTRFVY